jgi:DNA-binding CsgD family transcriptional regulator
MFAEAAELVDTYNGPGEANTAFRSLMDLELASIHDPIDPDAATETIGLLESCGFGYEAALVRLLLIDVLIASGPDRSRLEREVVELAEIATSCGMSWIAERLASLVKAIRLNVDVGHGEVSAKQSSNKVAYPHGLTGREVDVLSLLAEGLTNKTIGQQLYVSPRTVSTHVSNLLAKLGVANRGEAAAAYHRLGIESLGDPDQESTKQSISSVPRV